MGWKLVFVATTALVLAITAPGWSISALARASVPAPTRPSAPAGRSAERAQARAGDAILYTYLHVQPKASQRQPQPLASQTGTPEDVKQERRLSPAAILGLICSIAASSVALGIAFGLRRRIDRIAGPDPDKNDDD
jgi:hypothetical protein